MVIVLQPICQCWVCLRGDHSQVNLQHERIYPVMGVVNFEQFCVNLNLSPHGASEMALFNFFFV